MSDDEEALDAREYTSIAWTDQKYIWVQLEGEDEPTRSLRVKTTVEEWRDERRFEVLKGWRNELYGVYAGGEYMKGDLLWSVERSASPLFGVITYGAHMTAYTSDSSGAIDRIWVARRSPTKQTYPGLLDNTVAGGLQANEDISECMVREAKEEANLSEEVMKRAVPCGSVSYFTVRGPSAGGETYLFQPEEQFVFDLELKSDETPKPEDKEVESFSLRTVYEVLESIANEEWKPNCALVMLDFLLRHKLLPASIPLTETDLMNVKWRLHRDLQESLDFPVLPTYTNRGECFW